jgi:hypothetical protein
MAKPRRWMLRSDVGERVFYNRDVRSQLRTGDVLLFRGDVAFSRLIESVAGGRYSHSAMVLRWHGRVMIAQAEWPRLEAVPMSVAVESYSGLVDWYRVDESFTEHLDRRRLMEEAMDLLGQKFAVRELLRVGLYNFFHRPVPRKERADGGYVCSEYVAHCFREAGLNLAPARAHDLAVTPDDLAKGARLALKGTIHWDEHERPAAIERPFVHAESGPAPAMGT